MCQENLRGVDQNDTLSKLREREKELSFLYSISTVLYRKEMIDADKLQEIVDLIPQAYQFPKLTVARLSLNPSMVYQSPNFTPSPWLLREEIGSYGSLEIYITSKPPETVTSQFPFLDQEKALISEIGLRLLKYLDETHFKETFKKNQQLTDSIFETGQAMAVVTKDLVVSRVNSGFSKLFGYEKGSSVLLLDKRFFVTPQVIETSKPIRREVRFEKEDGTSVVLLMTATPLFDGREEIYAVLHTFSDVSNLHSLVESHRSSRDKYLKLFNDSPSPIVELDVTGFKLFVDYLLNTGVKKESLQAAIEDSPDLLDQALNSIHLLNANQTALDLFESKNRTELFSMIVDLFFLTNRRTIIQVLLAIALREEGQNLRLRGSKPTGELLVLNTSFTVTNDWENESCHVIMAMADVTDDYKAQTRLLEMQGWLQTEVDRQNRALTEEKKRLGTIIETIAEGILVLDPQGYITTTNKAFREIYRKIFQKELELPFLIYEQVSNDFIKTVISVVTQKTKETRTVEPIEGYYLQLQAVHMIIEDESHSIGTVVEVRDITPFVQLENTRNEFVSMVSHELRTPITAIDLSINNILRYYSRMSEEQRLGSFQRIGNNAEILSRIIEDLLLVSRLRDKRLTMDVRPFSPASVVADVLVQLDSKLEEKQIKVRVEGGEEVMVLGDPSRVGQVFRIILDNAIKYSGESTRVDVVIKGDLNNPYVTEKVTGCLISFTDYGLGIKEKHLGQIFERFFRADTTGSIQGTGLGLSIAKEIITLLGGTIWVESKYQEYTTFSVVLSLHRGDQREKQRKNS